VNVTIYHNPRCSKSRATLALLEERGLSPEVVDYLKSPPSLAELSRLIALLDITPRQLIRSGEAAYKDLGLRDPDLDDAKLLQAMRDYPALIQRPIVVAGDAARIGRPPEAVLEIIPS
jgi:arsenate reductase